MLFIIATNNPNTVNTGTDQTSNQDIDESDVQSEDNQYDLVDCLIDRLENEASLENPSEDIGEDNGNNERVSFFSRLFSRGSSNDTEEQDEVGVDDSLLSEDNDDIEPSPTAPEVLYSPSDHNNQSHLSKGDNTYIASGISLLSAEYIYDFQQISEGNTDFTIDSNDSYFSVSVHSLRLNDASFTKTLGYLMNGDIVRKIGEKNIYGCFEIEVMMSQTSQGKKGFVCEKYITELMVESEEISNGEVKKDYGIILSSFPQTEIGDIITITSFQYDIDDVALFEGDTIDQMTEISNTGCFTGRVYSVSQAGYNELIGLVQEFCIQDIYKH
ncbi:hypothetical protein LAT59_01320 [Candidatus Gracilibacteria bacterium]|nr:hypothetical protein [Candidatus Gracilibacteria bacterium]